MANTPLGSFYALEPRWVTWDRFYKFYVWPGRLIGARIGGQVYDESSARVQITGLGSHWLYRWFASDRDARWAQRILYRVRAKEEEYDGMIANGDDPMQADKRNIQLDRFDVREVLFRDKRSLWTLSENAGTATFNLAFLRRQKFILTVPQSLPGVRDLVQSAGFAVHTRPSNRSSWE